MGLGCLLTEKRVTDHMHCESWEPIKPDKPENDQDAINQYHKYGYELRIDVIAS